MSPPAGLLYNHISKTGGTTIRDVLLKQICNQSVLRETTTHYNGSEDIFHDHAGCVLQDDVENLTVTSEDAASFFVLGSIRHPCDWYLSLWSYMSDVFFAKCPNGMLDGCSGEKIFSENPGWAMAANNDMLGKSPPYNNSADMARFSTWSAQMQAVEEKILEQGADTVTYRNSLLAYKVAYRYGNINHVHCWMRTDTLLTDALRCLEYYNSTCGGSIENADWHKIVESDISADATARPSQHVSCDAAFDAPTQASILERESAIMQSYGFPSLASFGIDTCCAPDAIPA